MKGEILTGVECIGKSQMAGKSLQNLGEFCLVLFVVFLFLRIFSIKVRPGDVVIVNRASKPVVLKSDSAEPDVPLAIAGNSVLGLQSTSLPSGPYWLVDAVTKKALTERTPETRSTVHWRDKAIILIDSKAQFDPRSVFSERE